METSCCNFLQFLAAVSFFFFNFSLNIVQICDEGLIMAVYIYIVSISSYYNNLSY